MQDLMALTSSRRSQVLASASPRSRRLLVMATVVTTLGVGIAAVIPSPARASIVRSLDLSELVQQADHIAVVDVLSLRSEWDTRHERILSTVELKVVERWKGTGATTGGEDRLTIVQPGGTVGDLSMTVTGMSTFAPGERAVVFLRGAANNARVLGMGQGKRPMQYDATARTWFLKVGGLRDLTVVKSVGPAGGTSTLHNAPASGAPATNSPSTISTPRVQSTARGLDDFRAEVKTLLGTPVR